MKYVILYVFIIFIFIFFVLGKLVLGQENNKGFVVRDNGDLIVTDSLATIQHFISENIKLQQQLKDSKIAALMFENDLLKLKNLYQQTSINMQKDLVSFFSDERVKTVSDSVLIDMIAPEFYKRNFLVRAYEIAKND